MGQTKLSYSSGRKFCVMVNRFIVFPYIGTVGYLSLQNLKLYNKKVPRRSDRNLLLNLIKFLIISYVLLLPSHLGAMEANEFSLSVHDNKHCFASNGIPNHKVGIFPNRGNPHSILPQQIIVCLPRFPENLSTYTKIRGIIGIALNGVLFRPNTAGFWAPYAPRKHSQRGVPNWNVDIFGLRGRLGLDFNNAHVGRGGMYHYHGLPTGLISKLNSSLVGYAGDDFEIHYLQNQKLSGWVLKKDLRRSGPPGRYDGTYNEDYNYIGGENKLD